MTTPQYTLTQLGADTARKIANSIDKEIYGEAWHAILWNEWLESHGFFYHGGAITAKGLFLLRIHYRLKGRGGSYRQMVQDIRNSNDRNSITDRELEVLYPYPVLQTLVNEGYVAES